MVCLLLVWRICDKAFGRYRTLNGAEKWSRDYHENWKCAYSTRGKILWFQKCYSFRSTTRNNEVIVENRFRTVASPGAWPSWIDARRQYILLVVSSFRAAMNMRWMNEFYLHLLICYLCNRALPFLCMHSAKLLWQIILSVRPSVQHILALYRNECTYRRG